MDMNFYFSEHWRIPRHNSPLGGYFVGSQEVFVSERKREYYHQRG